MPWSFSAQEAGNLLLQHLQDFAGISFGGFADEQVHVFGHNYIAEQGEGVTLAELMRNPHETVAGASGSQIGPPPVATERDKVEIVASVKPAQRMADNSHQRGATSKSAP
ncbi:MAG TPA: hypothetical protein VMU53_05725 [Candidatus Sulfotelmatobacter sp.]|nr:hypothetical protein [Candidatus Sulfotelmatobacter sp.]